jgi:predicted anti-sigma-YlaC factor YlaD
MTEPTFDWTDCDAIVRRLWPHLDGALAEEERVLILRHLETCGGCTAHFKFAQSFLDAVNAIKVESPELGVLREKVKRALAAEGFVESA